MVWLRHFQKIRRSKLPPPAFGCLKEEWKQKYLLVFYIFSFLNLKCSAFAGCPPTCVVVVEFFFFLVSLFLFIRLFLRRGVESSRGGLRLNLIWCPVVSSGYRWTVDCKLVRLASSCGSVKHRRWPRTFGTWPSASISSTWTVGIPRRDSSRLEISTTLPWICPSQALAYRSRRLVPTRNLISVTLVVR